MEETRNNRAVERRMKEALKNDRARIQVGRISHFGLLEMSRQRIRTGVLEGSTVQCQHCLGAGVVRSTSSIALHVLRVLEDALIRSSTHDMIVRGRTAVALYILNQKRAHLRDIERRFGVSIIVEADDSLTGSSYHAFERGEPATGQRPEPEAEPRHAGYGAPPDDEDFPVEETQDVEDAAEPVEAEGADDDIEVGESEGELESAHADGEAGGEDGDRRRRRRRRRRRGERGPVEQAVVEGPQPSDDGLAVVAEIGGDFSTPTTPASEGEEGGRPGGARRRRSRRGRRGERFSPQGEETGAGEEVELESAATDLERGGTEGEAEATTEPKLLQPELPWHMPVAAAEAPAAQVEAEVAEAKPEIETAPAAAAAETASEAAEPAAEPAATPEPEEVEPEGPPRPRRTGWWQRARATLVGQ